MKFLLLIITSIFLYQCQTNSSNRWDTDIFEATQKLEADKLYVDIEIDGKKFYSKEVPFKGSIMLNKLSCLINLVNTDGGHIAISLEEEDWHKKDKKSIQFKDAIAMQGEMNGSFLIGRRQGDKGEGYFIKDGSFEIRQLNEEACIIVVQGILQNPFNETITKPINGLILWKKPKVFANNPQANQFLFN